MLDRIEGVEGFTVEAMAQRPGAFELIVGATVDPTFGPVILFGQGGVGVEAIGDTTLALPPLDLELARVMIGRTRIARLLRGYRGRPPVNMDALAGALVSVSRMMLDHPEIVEFDINPILADASGVIAVDARGENWPTRRAVRAIRDRAVPARAGNHLVAARRNRDAPAADPSG